MKILASALFVSTLLLIVSCEKTAEPSIEKQSKIEMAITFDDLPVSSRASVEQMVSALNKHQVPTPYGFVTGSYIYRAGTDSTSQQAILDYWLQQGFSLGNHGFNHLAIKRYNTPAEAWRNIQMNERALQQIDRYQQQQKERVYRYTFLDEGFNTEIGNTFRHNLVTQGYKIAHVSINPADWIWAEKYQACRKQNNEEAMTLLKDQFIQYTLEVIKSRQEAAQMLLQREMKHILLLHANEFMGEVLEPLLVALSQSGVTFISLDEAMSDPLYQQYQQQTLPKQSDILNKQALMTRQYNFSTPTQPQLPTNFAELCT